MTTGSNFLNEHIIEKARVHYAITDTGGVSPNVSAGSGGSAVSDPCAGDGRRGADFRPHREDCPGGRADDRDPRQLPL